VVPTLDCAPDFGLQLTLTGAIPPLNLGSENFMSVFPRVPLSVTDAIVGHVRLNGAEG
jgi:hypothetical protein